MKITYEIDTEKDPDLVTPERGYQLESVVHAIDEMVTKLHKQTQEEKGYFVNNFLRDIGIKNIDEMRDLDPSKTVDVMRKVCNNQIKVETKLGEPSVINGATEEEKEVIDIMQEYSQFVMYALIQMIWECYNENIKGGGDISRVYE